MRRKRRKAVASIMSENRASVTTLWKFPEDCFDEWLELEMGEADDYEEYLERLRDAEQVATQHGLHVLYCTASPRKVFERMIQQSLDPTSSQDRATAIAMLAAQEHMPDEDA